MHPDLALDQLWRLRLGRLAHAVAEGGREHRELAHAAALFAADYHDRFLVELLQNANDQALRGAAPGAAVVIVRTEGLLAVSNGGAPLSEENVERISSLADSDKTGELVGNKGIGFKAVYQVTDAPELYSSQLDRPGASLYGGLGIGFALERKPFETAEGEGRLRVLLQDVLDSQQDVLAAQLQDGLRRRHPTLEPIEAVLAEARRAPGFKFPTPRGQDALDARLAALGLTADLGADLRTLVVLPLRDEEARTAVGRVLERFCVGSEGGPSPAELAVLLLPGVGRIDVIDRVQDQAWCFERLQPAVAPKAGRRTERTVRCAGPTPSPRPSGERTDWCWTEDVFGGPAEQVAARRACVAALLETTGLEAWQADDALHVTVALPKRAEGEDWKAAGRFCVGLATEQPTGLPVHVDARFFTKIDRRAVGFEADHAYNTMLLDVAVEALDHLLAALRADARIGARRAATLALLRGPGGALADRVFAPGGIADGEVVLGWGGRHFLRRGACARPNDSERALLPLLKQSLDDHPDLAGRLPELGVDDGVLESLELAALRVWGQPHPWLDRGAARPSLVEAAAERHRAAGPGWWQRFVHALLDAFVEEPAWSSRGGADLDPLRDHRWLPVAAADLRAPNDTVLLPPEEDGDPHPAVRVGVLPALDTAAIPSGSEALNALLKRGLVVKPEGDALFVAGLPALRLAIDAGDDGRALAIFGLLLAALLHGGGRGQVKVHNKGAPIRVPVSTVAGGVAWIAADQAYAGEGWLADAEQARLLAQTYPGRVLLPLAAVVGGGEGLPPIHADAAAILVQRLGVATTPRVLPLRPVPAAPLIGSRHTLSVAPGLSVEPAAAEPTLRRFLDEVAKMGTSFTKLSCEHTVEPLDWIDGLEDEDRRAGVFDLLRFAHVGMEAGAVERVAVRRLKTDHPEGAHNTPLWLFALKQEPWLIIPTQRGARGPVLRSRPEAAWLLNEADRAAPLSALLSVVPAEWQPAAGLLRQLGVVGIDDAPADRVAAALHALGRLLAAAPAPQPEPVDQRAALSLASRLYERLSACGAEAACAALSQTEPLPFVGAEGLVGATATDGRWLVVDDAPLRAPHLRGRGQALGLPIGRKVDLDVMHAIFTRLWGADRVLRASSAPLDLVFWPDAADSVPLLAWLVEAVPPVAVELAALLSACGLAPQGADDPAARWAPFAAARLSFGRFNKEAVRCFYAAPELQLCAELRARPHRVVASTWALLGVEVRDLVESYAAALHEGRSAQHLVERGVGEPDRIAAEGLVRAASPQLSLPLDPSTPAAVEGDAEDADLDDQGEWFSWRGPSLGPTPAGPLGEAHAHRWLGQQLGERYDPAVCWRSSARGGEGFGPGDDRLGFDFEVEDPDGALGIPHLEGRPCRTVRIEVKSTDKARFKSLWMSRHEWEVAKQHHFDPGGPLYALLLVTNALSEPAVAGFIPDPYGAHLAGDLELQRNKLLVKIRSSS